MHSTETLFLLLWLLLGLSWRFHYLKWLVTSLKLLKKKLFWIQGIFCTTISSQQQNYYSPHLFFCCLWFTTCSLFYVKSELKIKKDFQWSRESSAPLASAHGSINWSGRLFSNFTNAEIISTRWWNKQLRIPWVRHVMCVIYLSFHPYSNHPSINDFCSFL